MKENSTDKVFGQEFFDAGKKELGFYGTYRLEDLYPQFSILATWIKNHFNPARVLDVGCAKGYLINFCS
jgi:2-polyprenyl-3-methyl-5-hydroxy-6-metoxy-1,4-benzoquinol methylase